MGLVLRDGGRLAGSGVLAGLAVSPLLARLLVPIGPPDFSPAPWVWLAGPIVLIVAVTIASFLMTDELILLRDNN